MTSLLAKARALEIEGVSTFIFSGSYEIPVRTLTGSVRSDLILIDKVVGAGEIAVSDHRSSQPTFDEIARLGGRVPGRRHARRQGRRPPSATSATARAGSRRSSGSSARRRSPSRQIVPTHMHPQSPALRARPRVGGGGRLRRRHRRARARAAGSRGPLRGRDRPLPGPGPALHPDDGELGQQREHAGLRRERTSRPAWTSPRSATFSARSRTSSDGELLPVETAVRVFSTNAADFYKLGKKGRDRGRPATPTSSCSTRTSA
ncbi:MAG: hypothetical protein M0C28_15030 [Candidatus Moduliflexus flocculans]|nr:hypothetical protein [Candidatus Moduliflexus flocculans]